MKPSRLVFVALAFAVLGWSGCGGRDPWAAIEARFANGRPFEPRISNVPLRSWSTRRGTAPAGIDGSADLELASALLDKAAAVTPSSAAYQRAAVGRLLVDDPGQAVTFLERAVRLSPAEPSLRSDLAAAYLLRADRSGSRADIVRALDTAQRAVDDTNGANAVALFNLALAQDRLWLRSAAHATWRRAAAIEERLALHESRDRAEGAPAAADRQARLDGLLAVVEHGDERALGRALEDDADLVGELLERRVSRRWAEAVVAGRSDDARAGATRMRLIAKALYAAQHENYPRELVDALTACAKACAGGWSDHLDALEFWDREQFAQAREASGRADERLGIGWSPINAGRVLVRVTLARLDGQSARAQGWLRDFRRYVERREYLSLSGRMTWQMGLLASEAGDVGEAMSLYRIASDRLQMARDREGRALVESLLAFQYQQLEDEDRAWEHQFAALEGLSVSRPLRRSSILQAAAAMAASMNLDAAALAFRTPMVEHLRTSAGQSAVPLAFLLGADARSLIRLNRRADAEGVLREAGQILDRFDDAGTSAMARAWLRAADGEVASTGGSPLAASAAFEQALGIYRSRGEAFAIPELELANGRALRTAGRLDDAEAAFARGVESAEREIGSARGANQFSIASARWDLVTSLADLRLRRGDDAAAAALLDRSRTAGLAAHLRGAATARPPLAHATIVEYAVLPSGVVGWVTRAGVRERFSIPVTVEVLTDLVAAYRNAVVRRADRQQVAEASRRLFMAAFGTIGNRIDGANPLVIVPDGPLYAVPFAALEDPRTGASLVDRMPVIVAPSASYFSQRDVSRSAAATKAVIVGNPDRRAAVVDRAIDLPGSAREADAVARIYADHVLAIGAEATPKWLLDHAQAAEVIHFAGHALVNERRPDLSRLLMTAGPDDGAGAVFAKDIEALDLSRARLVVLSACDTASGHPAHGAGVLGLVRAFLSAGASTVVATLWPVDDRVTAEWSAEFHERWRAGEPVAVALQHAQQSIRHRHPDVVDWAAAVAVGASVVH